MSPAKHRGASSDTSESLLAALLEFQRMLNAEASAAKAFLRADQKRELALKQAKLDLERSMIDQMKSEARERYDQAMEAARLALVLGIAPGTVPDRFAEYQASLGKAADRMQRLINELEKESQDAAGRTASSDADCKAARERRQKGLDNIQKLLDIIRSMNPQL